MEVVLIGLIVLSLRIVQDVLFLAKIDAFNRSARVKILIFNFIEALYTISVFKVIIDLMDSSYFYAVIFALGSSIAGVIVSKVKSRLDDKLEGQRKFFARISIDRDEDTNELIQLLKERDFDFIVDDKRYITGVKRTVIQGSLENRERVWELKELLRGRPGKHLVILRAEDAYHVY